MSNRFPHSNGDIVSPFVIFVWGSLTVRIEVVDLLEHVT
jgi:hypothetical protein